MKTLNEQIKTINSFNNAAVLTVNAYSWGGNGVVFSATDFAFQGIKRELGIVIEKMGDSEYMFISMLPKL